MVVWGKYGVRGTLAGAGQSADRVQTEAETEAETGQNE